VKIILSVLKVLFSYWIFCYFSVCGTDSFSVKSSILFWWGGHVSGCGTKPDPGLECLNMLHLFPTKWRLCRVGFLTSNFLTQKFTTVFRHMKQMSTAVTCRMKYV